MPREVDISTHIEESSDEGTSSVLLKNMCIFTKQIRPGLPYNHAKSDSPLRRRAHGTSSRSRIIVISDSESDSDLPSPSLLLQDRKAVRPASNLGVLPERDEVIEISSDSEIEATPTKSRGKFPSSAHGHLAGLSTSSDSASVSTLTSVFHDSLSLNANGSPNQTNSTSCIELDKSTALSQPIEPGSTDSEEVDETRLFDQGVYHPGILNFDPGPRKPVLVTPRSGSSISTQETLNYSQDLYEEGGTGLSLQIGGPKHGCLDDSSEDTMEIKDPIESPRSRSTTGKAKASINGSAYRDQVRADVSEGAVPSETPRPRPKPKPKPRSAALTSVSSSAPLSPKPTPRNQAKLLQAAAINLFAELNDSVFGGKLPKDCPIEWSKKLNTTAGRAHWKRIRDTNGDVMRHETRIELSTKVVDCEERVRNTLSHEMCHLGAWIFDSEMKPPHGPAFKRWSNRIMETRPDITISTCHSYEITYKYEWKCSSEECGRTYGRHSKSIDPEKQVCGVCRNKLVPQFETAPKRTPFQDYLKIHMKDFKAANPGMQHGEAMKRLGEMFRAEKEAIVDEELDHVMDGMTRLGISSLAK